MENQEKEITKENKKSSTSKIGSIFLYLFLFLTFSLFAYFVIAVGKEVSFPIKFIFSVFVISLLILYIKADRKKFSKTSKSSKILLVIGFVIITIILLDILTE